MKRVSALALTGLALSAGVTFARADSDASPKKYIYSVTVHTNFGTTFQDCFSFSKTILTISGLGKLVYTAAPSMPAKYYTAVTSVAEANSLGASFAFSGFKKGNAEQGQLYAVGADEFHDSYRITGTAVPACPPSDSSGAPGAKYRPVAQ